MMRWSSQQDYALTAIADWLVDRDPYQFFLLFGYAGAGKTEIAREIGEPVSGVFYAAYTGKAVHVLRKRGCAPVSTIHKLIYKHILDPKTGFTIQTLKSPEELADVRLLIVDEASMVNAALARDLISFGFQILIIADPMQLPPVEGGVGYFMRFKPDVMLNEVHRQALNSPILRLATDVRQGKQLWKKGCHDGLLITDGVYARDGMDHDVVLVGTHDTKDHWNRKIRRDRGFIRVTQKHRDPQVGETLICKRNDYAVEDEIFNGQLWTVDWIEPDGFRTREGVSIPILKMSLRNDDGRTEVCVRRDCFDAAKGKVEWVRGLQLFDFGYAITVHSAQGSEWRNVLLINEARAFQGSSRQWLYTGITRASDRLTIIDGN